jgi:hypothetical protein
MPHSCQGFSVICTNGARAGSLLTVNIKPGDTEFTLILGAQITARDFARCICAAFVTAYAYMLLAVSSYPETGDSGKCAHQRTPTRLNTSHTRRRDERALRLIQMLPCRIR